MLILYLAKFFLYFSICRFVISIIDSISELNLPSEKSVIYFFWMNLLTKYFHCPNRSLKNLFISWEDNNCGIEMRLPHNIHNMGKREGLMFGYIVRKTKRAVDMTISITKVEIWPCKVIKFFWFLSSLCWSLMILLLTNS